MPAIELNLENIHLVRGGKVALALSKALHRMCVDLETAPDIGEWREVTLKIRAKPVCEEGELAEVAVEFVIPHAKLPARSTATRAQLRSTDKGARQLFFAEDFVEDNFDQSMIPIGGEAE